jgi:NAD(P)-dependent dehydrogenase (short-subunit alcohol dehydrogenase family)
MKKVALITGVMGGIGSATMSAFLEQGWQVFGLDKGVPKESLDDANYLKCDLADPIAIEKTIAEITQSVDRMDALVNNAAAQITKPLTTMTLEEWDLIMETNLRPAFLTVKHSYPMLKRAKGTIINVSSVHAVATSKDIAAYAASKGGLVALTRAMAIEFADDGIRVNAILPGAVDTPMLRDGIRRGHVGDGTDEELLDALGQKTVMGRVGQPEEIAQTILYLADPQKSGFMTGHPLIVDGGATIRLSTE